MELKQTEIKNKRYLPITEFIQLYHPGLSKQAILYAIRKDWLDYYSPGRERFIVLTKKSMLYKPMFHPKRQPAGGV